MSEGLWRDDLRCGCQRGKGHVCRPSWMTEAEWLPNRPGQHENLAKISSDWRGPNGAGTPDDPLTADHLAGGEL